MPPYDFFLHWMLSVMWASSYLLRHIWHSVLCLFRLMSMQSNVIFNGGDRISRWMIENVCWVLDFPSDPAVSQTSTNWLNFMSTCHNYIHLLVCAHPITQAENKLILKSWMKVFDILSENRVRQLTCTAIFIFILPPKGPIKVLQWIVMILRNNGNKSWFQTLLHI